MILAPAPDGVFAIRQSAHAALAFQLADHWGNRMTLRPSPRAEVLAAALLHDAGWDDAELPARIAPDGRPEAFDTAPGERHAAIWRRSVARATAVSRYTGYLVASHVTMLAEASGNPESAVPDLIRHRDALGVELAAARETANLFRTGADAANRAIVRVTDALAVQLCRGLRGGFTIDGVARRDGAEALEVSDAGSGCLRITPWPFAGRRLTVRTEARLLPAERFADDAALGQRWEAAPVVRLSWTLLPTGAPVAP